jgi:hypothetical protein
VHADGNRNLVRRSECDRFQLAAYERVGDVLDIRSVGYNTFYYRKLQRRRQLQFQHFNKHTGFTGRKQAPQLASA